jgi:putative nucleotidyltransferase with HDIG domain
MIKLKTLLKEGAIDRAAVDFLSQMVKKSKWKGKVFLAGGYVRDELLGLDPKDIDIVIEFPQGGIKFAEWITKKLKIYKKGSNPVVYPKFGTAAFRLYGVNHKGYDLSKIEIEAVMTRKEQYKLGDRKPKVSAGSLKDDVERRDFTVNSLLKDLTTGEILDLTGMGKTDLKKGVVQTPLDPDVIFKDDPLRMLRAIRFTVKYGWDLPMFMIKALKRNSHMLKTISAERIMSELSKMMVTKAPDKAIRLLQMTNLNKYVAGELDELKGLEQTKHHKFDAMKHTLEVLKNTPPELETRLAALFHDIGKATTKKVIDNEVHFYEHEDVSAEMAEAILRRLKYPMDVIKKVKAAIAGHMRTKAYGGEAEGVTDKTLRKLKNDMKDHLQTTLDLIHADNISHADGYNMPMQIPKLRDRLKALEKEPDVLKRPIDGNDIMKRYKINNKTHGMIIGQLLKAIDSELLGNPALTKKQAFAITDRMYKTIGE